MTAGTECVSAAAEKPTLVGKLSPVKRSHNYDRCVSHLSSIATLLVSVDNQERERLSL